MPAPSVARPPSARSASTTQFALNQSGAAVSGIEWPEKPPRGVAMPNHPATPPDPNKPGEAAARTKMRRPNRLRGPDAPAAAAKGRQAAFVPKLLFEILPQPQRDTLPEAAQ